MADAKRGFVPEDERNFSPEAIEKMRIASRHISWLLDEGYDLKQSAVFVGNHFLLSERQRLAIMRSVASRKQQLERKRMRMIISPAKQMRVDTDTFACNVLPVFLDRTKILMDWIRSLSYEQQKTLWACNDKIARQNAERFAHMDLQSSLTPALLAYDGIQYTYMAPAVFEDGQFDYVQEHLRILSGFYGVVKPMDGVVPYRLEMQAKAVVDGHKNLYDFWGDDLYREVMDESRILVNLASKEYSKCIEKYLTAGDRYITCIFGEQDEDRIVQKGVYAKMARGEMVRFMAGIQAEEPEQLKEFNWSGYRFDDGRSTETEYVFIRSDVTKKT